jgi:hypothetical protein
MQSDSTSVDQKYVEALTTIHIWQESGRKGSLTLHYDGNGVKRIVATYDL